MENKTPLSVVNKKNLQARLVLVFSALFVFSVLALSVFLFNVLQLIRLNDQARFVFEETRRIYQLETMFKQYQLGLVNYAISSSSLAEMRLTALDRRIDETLQALKDQSSIDASVYFQEIGSQKETLSVLAGQIIDAVDEQDALDYDGQDWEHVEQLTLQANQHFDALYGNLSSLSLAGQEQLNDLQEEAELFSFFAMGIALLSIPAFLFLALVVALIIYAQIHLPLEQLTRAAHDLKERQFRPADIEKLARRGDEIGDMAREFMQMSESVQERTSQLAQEAEEIRLKIK